jgi:hypothetical protein
MYSVIRFLVTSSAILVYGGEIRGYTLPGLAVFGERGN